MHFSLRLLLLLLPAGLFAAGCGRPPAPPKVEVLQQVLLDSLPAASALTVRDGSLFLVSDNAPALFRMSAGLAPASLRRLALPRPDSAAYELPKPVKPDYEASLELVVGGHPALLAFGSGSRSPQRDSLLLFPLDGSGPIRTLPAGRLYAHIRAVCGIGANDFNLEAAAFSGEWMYLGNRGTNSLLQLKKAAFLAWLEVPESAPLPAIVQHRLDLPRIGGRLTGLSGLGELPDGRLLFCASAEATDNSYDDGAVLGSVAGIVVLSGTGAPGPPAFALLTDGAGRVLPQKLESVALLKKESGQSWRILAVADNDNGSSTLFELRLKF